MHETKWWSLGMFQVGFSHGLWDSYIPCIRQLGATWAWSDLLGCAGAMLGVTGVGTGATFGAAGMVGTAAFWGFRITGIVGATGAGDMGCTGLVGAGCAGWLLWHLEQCQQTWHCIHAGVISCSSRQYHCWCIPGSCPWVGCMSL